MFIFRIVAGSRGTSAMRYWEQEAFGAGGDKLSLEVRRLDDDDESAEVAARDDAHDNKDAVEQSDGRRWEDENAHVPVLACSLLCVIRP